MKIRGNTVGTPMRPEKAVLVAAEAMTEEQKAQVRENIGAASAESIGDIESALDTIIAIQEELINNGGGDSGGSDNTCPNCGEFTGDGPCPNNCYEMEQTFYVDGSPYTFYAGMTWEDFINSGYNKTVTCSDCGSKNKQAYTDGDSVYFLIGACCGIGHVPLCCDEGCEMPVYPTDAIESDCFYYY